MEKTDRMAFARVMSELSSIYKGQQASGLNKSDLDIWFNDLSPWPIEDIREAARLWRTDTTPAGNGRVLGEYMPRIANIIARLKIIAKNRGYVFDHRTGKYVERPLLTVQETDRRPVPPPKEFTEAMDKLLDRSPGPARQETEGVPEDLGIDYEFKGWGKKAGND